MWTHYLPIATTLIAVPFALQLLRRYGRRGGLHHLVWGVGVVCYGAGTALESVITLSGNTVALNKAWYVTGALLGAYPLAQGSAYLHFSRRRAHATTAVTLPFVALLATLVVLSPVEHAALELDRPSGSILAWSGIRRATPLLNGYAALLLVGTAAWSARRLAGQPGSGRRASGNALIAVGALLPGIGGALAKAGTVEALYVAELAGLLLIWAGYARCVRE